MAESIQKTEAIDSASSQDINVHFKYHPGYEGVLLMHKTEQLHQKRLLDLDAKQQAISNKLSVIKDELKRCYRLIKNNPENPAEGINLSEHKDSIIKLWEEWKAELKESDPEEYNNLTLELDKLDFSKLSLEMLDDKLVPELEKIQRHHEFKYQQIPNELRMFIELFTILVEILKELPKKYAESISQTIRNSRG